MKQLVLQAWQLAALRAGRLRAVWVPLEPQPRQSATDVMDDITAWTTHGVDPATVRLPYAVGDVVEMREECHNCLGRRPGSPDAWRIDHPCRNCRGLTTVLVARVRITAVAVRRVDGVTPEEARDAGIWAFHDHPFLLRRFRDHYRTDHHGAGE